MPDTFQLRPFLNNKGQDSEGLLSTLPLLTLKDQTLALALLWARESPQNPRSSGLTRSSQFRHGPTPPHCLPGDALTQGTGHGGAHQASARHHHIVHGVCLGARPPPAGKQRTSPGNCRRSLPPAHSQAGRHDTDLQCTWRPARPAFCCTSGAEPSNH